MQIKKPHLLSALLLIGIGIHVNDALACQVPTPARPIVDIAPEALLSVYRAAYGSAGFQYRDEERRGYGHVQLHFQFTLHEFRQKKKGKLSIAFNVGKAKICNPCGVHLVHMNVGNDYTSEQYKLAQTLIEQKHNLAEAELLRRLGDKIKPTPPMPACQTGS